MTIDELKTKQGELQHDLPHLKGAISLAKHEIEQAQIIRGIGGPSPHELQQQKKLANLESRLAQLKQDLDGVNAALKAVQKKPAVSAGTTVRSQKTSSSQQTSSRPTSPLSSQPTPSQPTPSRQTSSPGLSSRQTLTTSPPSSRSTSIAPPGSTSSPPSSRSTSIAPLSSTSSSSLAQHSPHSGSSPLINPQDRFIPIGGPSTATIATQTNRYLGSPNLVQYESHETYANALSACDQQKTECKQRLIDLKLNPTDADKARISVYQARKDLLHLIKKHAKQPVATHRQDSNTIKNARESVERRYLRYQEALLKNLSDTDQKTAKDKLDRAVQRWQAACQGDVVVTV
jgi:hypothetical protein